MNETPRPLTRAGDDRRRALRAGGRRAARASIAAGSWPSISCTSTPKARAACRRAGRGPRPRVVVPKPCRPLRSTRIVRLPSRWWRGEDQRLPARALVPLAVGRQAEDAPRLALEPLGQRQPGRQRQPVAQAAGGEQESGDPLDRRVAASLVSSLWNCRRSSSVSRPRDQSVDVKRARGVPLREHELIVRPEHAVVQRQQQVEAGQVPADVADPALVVHPQQAQPRLPHVSPSLTRSFCSRRPDSVRRSAARDRPADEPGKTTPCSAGDLARFRARRESR